MKKKSNKNSNSWLKAQLFYCKQAVSNACEKAPRVIMSAGKVAVLSVCMMVAAMSANNVHKSYLEYHVGRNTLYIQSMPDSLEQGSGTAFEVKAPSGKVFTVTNAHVCGLANANKEIQIFDKVETGKMVVKKVLQVYDKHDLCIVEGLEGYDGLSIGSHVSVGDTVYAYGYALGEAMNFAEGRVKQYGTTTLLDPSTKVEECVGPGKQVRTIPILFWIVPVCTKTLSSINTSVFIYPGNSGSAMVNFWGNVVGVFFAGNTRTNWGNAVGLDSLNDLLSKY